MLSSNEVYYTDESAQGKNFFKKFSDPVIGQSLGTFLNDQSFKNVPNVYMKAPPSGCA